MDVKLKNCTQDYPEKVGKVSVEESNALYALFKHLNSLEELEKIITVDDEAYERFKEDYQVTQKYFQQWWDNLSQKYNWKSIENGKWEINFETCEIFLIKHD